MPPRRIIHVDMDCFYAAVEVRDEPSLRGLPVAVGGSSQRGVLTTCTYEARAFGVHSAMPVFLAREKCPDLIVVPTRFDVYRAESARVRGILGEYTSLVEPLSLDEAYLDVSHHARPATAIAREIRARIKAETGGLTASAGISVNKMLAKVASDWRKPDGQFTIPPDRVSEFVRDLPVRKIHGVGPAAARRLKARGVETCADLQAWPREDLMREFGKFGWVLHDRCRGVDERPVSPRRERKSMSNERTFARNLETLDECAEQLELLHAELMGDLAKLPPEKRAAIRGLVCKLKFADFRRTTVESAEAAERVEEFAAFGELLRIGWRRRQGRAVRLLGAGVRFATEDEDAQEEEAVGEVQAELFAA